MERKVFLQLLDKYLNGTATPQEKRLLEEYYRRLDKGSKLDLTEAEEKALQQAMLKNIRLNIHGQYSTDRRIRKARKMRYLAAAAVVILLLSAGSYILWHKRPAPQIAQEQTHDISPGSNKATLTLANGSTIILDKIHEGQVASQGHSKILKVNSGLLAYQAGAEATDAQSRITYNTLSTPRGGQYRLVLPDGTKVWLNAASSITYPTRFAGPDRKVTIEGEAYFEVARQPQHPFIVTAGKAAVTVLGTHFDVMAYNDEEAFNTTLLEGSVMVSSGSRQAIIRPGQQASINYRNDLIAVNSVDTMNAVAWVKGQFSLESDDINMLMRKISRWYDVEVQFEGEMPKNKFFGTIDRNVYLSNILEALSTYDIKARLEGRTIIVSSK